MVSRQKKINVQTQKENKLLNHFLTDIITELNELIYAGVNLVSDKNVNFQKNPPQNCKSRMKSTDRRTDRVKINESERIEKRNNYDT